MKEKHCHPLTIGVLTLKSNLIQAPLAGISCAPFRRLAWQFGHVGYCVTEMQSSHQLATGIDRSPRYTYTSPNEGTLCWQLSGDDPDLLARASEAAITKGAHLLDLNCGCPKAKIRSKGYGSKLLSQTKKLATLISAMRQDNHIPVTIKIRVDGNSDDNHNLDIAHMAEDTGADAIIVHGRHWQDDYSVPCHYDNIATIKAAVSIPIIGNGDIKDYDSMARMFTQTGCDGAMIARASVGQPWLFAQLWHQDTGTSFAPPTTTEIGQLLWQHVTQLAALEGEHGAVLQSRRFIKYYARHIDNLDLLSQQVNQCMTLADIQKLLVVFFA